MKKIYLLLLSILPIVIAQNGYSQGNITTKKIAPTPINQKVNYTSFTHPGKVTGNEVVEVNKGYEQDPELGMLPQNAPCSNCYELIGQRTETSKTFAKTGSYGKDIIIRSSSMPMHYRDAQGRWKTISNNLLPDNTNAGVYTTQDQPVTMKVDAIHGLSTIKNKNTDAGITYNRNLEMIYVNAAGEEHSLGQANWGNYTAGDNGVYVKDAWPGIDIEMSIQNNGIKTNFTVNHALPDYADGKLLLRDHMQLTNGLSLSVPAGEKYMGDINVINHDKAEVFKITQAIAYEQHDAKATLQTLNYIPGSNNTLDIEVPGSMLNKSVADYPLIIDPLVVTNSVTGPNFSPYPALCNGTNNVPIPAGVTISDIQVSYAFIGTTAGANLMYGYFSFGLYSCNTNVGGYFSCTSAATPLYYCGMSLYSIYPYLSSCVPGMSCTAYTLPMVVNCTQTRGVTGGTCSAYYFYSYLPFEVDVYGTTTPVPTPITGTTALCIAGTSTLSNSTTGGVWSSSTTSVATIDPSTGVVTGVAAGTSTISYTLSGCTATAIVTVNAIATISGSSTVCDGSTTTLTDATGGTWSSSNTSVAVVGVSTGIVTGLSTGIVTFICSSPTGCVATHAMTVNPLPSAITGTLAMCPGSTTTLSDASGSGTWSSSTTSVAIVSSSGIVTGISGGTSVITYTLATGCYVGAVVTVNATPSAITGSLGVCLGSTSTLTDATTGGTWTSSTTSVATVGVSTGVVTGMAIGTSTIIYTNTTTGCTTSAIVTVNSLPSAITGTASLCVAATTTLSDATLSGTWASGSISIATVGATTGIVSGVAAGTTVITYTLGTGCTATTIVTVKPLPAPITGPLSVCTGSTATLADASGSGTWSSSLTSVATIGAATGIVSGISSGTATTTFTATSTGCYITAVDTVNSLPPAISGSLGVCFGATSTLSDGSPGGTWASSNTAVATISSSGVVSGIALGTSVITYTLNTGCYNTSVVTVNTLPSAITGTLTVCQGATTSLSDGTTGGTWSSGSTDIATIGVSTGVVTGLTGGFTSVITYTSIAGCTATAVVTVNITPGSISGVPRVCVASTTTLLDVTNGGTWSSSLTSTGTVGLTTGIVTGVAAGVTTISYILPTGCYATTPVTVNALPAAITGALNVCVGQNTTLNDATTGGTWLSGTGSVAAIGGLSGIATGMGGGTSVITYTSTLNCTINAVVTVHALPDAISGTLAVCQGLTTTLSDDSTGGTWTSGTTTIGTIGAGTGIATGVSGGTTTITYTLPTGCITTAVLTVNTLPSAITGTASVCIGLTTTLSNSSGAGTWSSSNTGVATISSSGVVSGMTQGTSTITFVLPTGCQITKVVTVNPLPLDITGTEVVCAGSTTTLSDASSPGTWSSSTVSVATVGAATGIVTGVSSGTTTIVFTLSTGCTTTAVVTVNPIPAAITGTASVCVGLTTTLNDASGTGTWSSSNTSVATVDAATGIVTGVSFGNSTITYKFSTGCYVTIVVTVNPLPTAIGGTAVVCTGNTTTLTDGAGGGTWSSSNTLVATAGLTTGIVTGVATGTSKITYTLGTGCIMTTTVTVNQTPAAISGSSGVCFGSSITLTDGFGGGTWLSSNSGIASVGNTTGIVTGVTVGNATISYVLTTTGCYVTRSMTVNPLPSAISGPSTVCAAGSTITLSDSPASGIWTSSTTAVATAGLTTGIITGVASGTTTITYTLITGCTATTVITVNPVPGALITPLGDTTFCPGGFVMLTANTGSGLSYLWYDNSIFISGAVTSTYLANASGSYQVKVTNGFSCSSLSAPMAITVDTPVATITVLGGGTGAICSGSPVTLDANTGVGYSYQWLLSGVPISGAVSSSYTTLTAGDYSVIVTNSTGCSATSSVLTITISPSPSATVTLSGPLTFCQNDSVVLSVPAGNTYQWYSLSGGAIAGATDSSFTATTADNYWVVVSNTYGCNSISVTDVVVVNPLPDVTITPGGPTIFCSGGSVMLNAVTGTGLTYQWYDGGTAISGATDTSYTATTSGGYRVQVTDGATGCTDKTHADTVVTDIATPVVIPMMPTSFCWGGSCLLSTSVTGAAGIVTYQWFKDGISISGASGSTYNATESGNYFCKVAIAGSCTLTTASVTVTENPLPNPVITYSGTTLSTATYFTSYQWYKDLTSISGANTFSTIATGDGNYKVAVTDTNGCQSFSDVYVVTGWNAIGTTGVGTVKKGEVQIYPNPAHDMVHVESVGDVRVVISSVDGRMLIDQVAKDINISGLADGVYMIMVYDTTGNMLKADKLVKASK